ncbi:group I intron endonuclease [Aneurinibacillus soli]|uniref:NUMOD3 motif protein n=1 Tax=Aneurinibacillus soli TaxID=1500254 RepID=A0A0U5B3A4_9BACL|nr:NUMOD3 domain-containing DNA-binding protein [Aneurinibacillus soli]PYE61364.1 group I intron endonuclease [Aneurinibacillus soli]BAU27807.1 NUMOD3 motif protein [Aneurinibacillus soli]
MQYVYKIINKWTGKFYVGRTNDITNRLNRHKVLLRKGLHHSIHLQRSWDKYGEESFVFVLFKIFNTGNEEVDLHLAKKLEQHFIINFMPLGFLYNRSWSSETGSLRGKEHPHYNKKPNEWMTEEGYKRRKEFYASGVFKGENNPFYGRGHTKEVLEILSKKCANFGEKNGFYGKHHTEETKEKISIKNKGRLAGEKNPFYGKTHTEEFRKRMAENARKRFTGKPISEEQKQNMRAASPKNTRVRIEGREYISISEASRALGVDRKTVSYRIHSKSQRFKEYQYC